MEDHLYGNRREDMDCSLFSEDEYDIGDTPLSRSLARHNYRPPQSSERRSSSKWTSKSRQRDAVSDNSLYSPVGRHSKVNSYHGSPGKNVDGVFLGEEEQEFSGEGSGRGNARAMSTPTEGGKSGGWACFMMAVVRLDMWKLLLLGGMAGIVVAGVYQGGWSSKFTMGFSGQDNLLACDSTDPDLPCLTRAEQFAALQLAGVTIPYLHKRAGQFACGVKSVASPEVSIAQLKRFIPQLDSASSTVVQHFLYLVKGNPDWNIVWRDSNGYRVVKWQGKYQDSDLLLSTAPSLTLKCRVRRILTFCWGVLRLLLPTVAGVVFLVGVVLYYRQRRKEEEQLMYAMVEKITSILMKHAESVRRRPELLPYLAIVHVRDLLIPPSKKSWKLSVWKKACNYIARQESRVRVEQQQIAGEEFEVWRWIPSEMPINTEEPSSIKGSSDSSPSLSSAQKGAWSRDKNWYDGTTFDDDSGRNTGRNNLINLQNTAASQCIRLKNMFDYVRNMSQEHVTELEDSLLGRCAPHGGVVHISVDKKSTYGCVYLKMDSVKSAIAAYQALHGGWYKGKLVTAKYIPPAKYYKWFPAAANAKVHLRPSTSST